MQIAAFPTHDRHSQARLTARFLRVLLVVLIFGGFAPPARGIDGDALGGGDPDEPWHISADTISYDDRARRYVAGGNVRISRGAVRLTADHVRFDHRSMDADASGHVVLVSGRDVLIGDRIDINLQNQVGTLTRGTIFLEENHFYIRGDIIEKLGEDTYAAERASVSTCDGEAPAWKITGRNLKVTLDGYGVVRHAALWARNMPVLYSPVFVFPAKRERQTGLLPPEFGTSSRKGTFYTQPFFWAIDEQSDLTYAPQYLGARGVRNNLEYRYIRDAASRGTIMADYLRDREVDDGQGSNSQDWGYEDDDFLRPNRDRYWLRMKHDQGLPFGFTGRIDLDIASDQDYLTEFRNDYGGFTETEDYFLDTYGRGLDDYNDPIRTNQGIITRQWDAFSLNGGVIWLDDTTRRWKDDVADGPKLDTQLQRLPLIRFDAMRQPLGDSPLLFNMDTEGTYFYSQDNTRATRIDLHPRVTWPLRAGRALYIEPSAGLRQTAWFVNDFQGSGTGEADKDRNTYRTLYDLKLDVSSEFSKVFDLDGASWQAVRHSVLPRVVYEYIPDKDQDEHPAFFQQTPDGKFVRDDLDDPDKSTALDDGINRIDPLNRITYSLSNNFTSKTLAPSSAEDGAEKPPVARYHDFLRVKLEQSYDIREARGSDRRDPERKRPFSPIRGELEYLPSRYLTLKADAEFDVYDRRLVSRNLTAVLSSPRGDELLLSYRFAEEGFRFNRKDVSDEAIESLYGRLRLKLPFRFTAYASNEYDFERSQRIETTLGLVYEAQCWSLDVRYKDEDEDQEISFLINLYGLGPIGLQ